MTPLSVSKLHHLALQAADVERVARFYVEVLGLYELKRHLLPDQSVRSIWLSVSKGNPVPFLAIERSTENLRKEPAGGWSMVAFEIDVQARPHIEAALTAQGHDIVKQTEFTLYLKDPEQNLVGLSHYPHPKIQKPQADS
jgi:glyoxylase I family protein